MVTHLFKDISCNLTTTAGLTLDEFNSMIPESMKTTVRGKASGQVKSRFTMSQVEKMQIEKMKLSGSVILSDFDVKYDSISLKTDRSEDSILHCLTISLYQKTPVLFLHQ